jgi:hypothetical protein
MSPLRNNLMELTLSFLICFSQLFALAKHYLS